MREPIAPDDAHVLQNEEQLRGIIGDEVPGLAAKNRGVMDHFAYDFIAKSPFLILATSGADGSLDASPKGDHPGFVEVVDEQTLLVPDRPGNKLAYGHLNVLDTGKVGLIFMIPGTRETLRINGDAELTANPEVLARLSARNKPATLAIRVRVSEVFFHCAKAYIRSGLWQPDSWPDTHRVSFGEMFAAQRAADAAGPDLAAADIDAAVEADYEHNL